MKKISVKRIVCEKEKKRRRNASRKKQKTHPRLLRKPVSQRSKRKDRISCQLRTRSTNSCARCTLGMLLMSELLIS
jgi:hypothetical protein